MRELGVSRESFNFGLSTCRLDYSCLEQLIVDLKVLINSFMAHTIYIPTVMIFIAIIILLQRQSTPSERALEYLH